MGIRAAILMMCFAAPAMSASEAEKQAQCQFQADLIGAVQQARLDRVRKDDAVDTVLEAHPEWPAGVAMAMPAVVEYVYGFKRRDLRNVDLQADTLRTCLENFDQIQTLKKTIEN